ncbi:FG-GAP repeat domain-containing protein [Streptomyces sp. NPDC059534]|uniref:FG-GAP repeat domain-containing protein n=1 Tax=Streptomyces sp. NPDC059534 TaxID=3346859 RepID=UPI0036B90D91
MLRPRTRTPLRLAAAVTAVLAVTAGTLATVPAAAAVPAAVGAVQDETVAPFPVDALVMSSGTTGFLSGQTGGGLVTYRWTRYKDGATTVLPRSGYGRAPQTDIVTHSDGGVFKLYDMGTGADPLEIDLTPLGEGYSVSGFAGTKIVAKKANAAGGTDIHIIAKQQDTLVDDTVTGLPADATLTGIVVDSPDSTVIQYAATVDGVKQNRVAVVDIATHAVVEEYERAEGTTGSTTLSSTHIAWVEKGADSTVKVAVARRDTGEVVRHALDVTDYVAIQLMGDWLTYRRTSTSSYATTIPLPSLASYARSLTTGETVKLLDHTKNSVPGVDGTQVARGGTIEQGEGLYRISPGADGARPTVTLVASTGEPTQLELLSHGVPESIDLDRDTVPSQLNWTLSRWASNVRLELVHTATQKKLTPTLFLSGGVYRFNWNGTFGAGNNTVLAPNGAYTWRLTAQHQSGIGPALVKTGTFHIVRKTVPHDFNNDGSPDLLIPDRSGPLGLFNLSQFIGKRALGAPEHLNTGHNDADRFLAAGNLGGTPHDDVLSLDRTGVLWLHESTGHALAPRTRIGGGWQIYDKLTAGSDVNGDNRPDLLATDKTGVMWLYKGTGSTTTPYGTRVKLGAGWGIYNQITATGNIAGAPAGDFVARDKAGVLWMYLGNGNGTFATRIRVGGGWNEYATTLGIGDLDRDGRNDLFALTDNGVPYYYLGTGSWRAPFQGRETGYSWIFLPASAF